MLICSLLHRLLLTFNQLKDSYKFYLVNSANLLFISPFSSSLGDSLSIALGNVGGDDLTHSVLLTIFLTPMDLTAPGSL